MPLGLFKGVRTFRSPPEDGATAFACARSTRARCCALIWRSMPDLGPSFDQFARGLKARAEN